MKSILDIDPSKITVKGKAWDDDELRVLSLREMTLFQRMAEYWKPILTRGRLLENRYEGKILTAEQREIYEQVENKIVLESPIAKAPIRALAGQCLKAVKSGQIITEGDSTNDNAGDGAAETEVLNAVMKDIETKTKEKHEINDAFMSALVSCYWNVLLFDKDKPSRNMDGIRYKMHRLPWNSCLFGPSTIKKPDGSDIKELFYFDYRTVSELIDNYPDMEKQIIDHFDTAKHIDTKFLSSLKSWDGGITAQERDTLYDVIINAASAGDTTTAGIVKVVMHLYPIKQKADVWVNIFDQEGEDYVVRPQSWNDARWNKWIQENEQKYFGPYEKEAVLLWVTVFTTSGLILSNEAHWFQENGMLPCSFWLGNISSNLPTGPMDDMSDNVLAHCVSKIENLDEYRKSGGHLLLMREGSVKDVDKVVQEANQAVGALFVSKDHAGPMSDAIQEMQRRPPNGHWGNLATSIKQEMFEDVRINESMMGQHSERQSAIAKQSEISQALTVNAKYIDNFNRSWEAHQNLKLKLISYFYNEHETLEVTDEETGGVVSVEVNAPAEYDMDGNVVSVVNNLLGHNYKYKISAVDDSETAQARSLEDLVMFFNTAAGPLLGSDPSGILLAETLMAAPNPIMQKTGRRLMEKAQQAQQAQAQQAQKEAALKEAAQFVTLKAEILRAAKTGIFTNFRAEDLNDYPGLYELFKSIQEKADVQAEQEMEKVQQIINPPQAQAPNMMEQLTASAAE